MARVLVFTTRNLTRHVARCSGYEFEDVVADCDDVDVIAPSSADDGNRFVRYARSLISDLPQVRGELIVDQPHDLFFFYCPKARDLRYLELIHGLHQQCRTSICVISELWPTAIAESRAELERLNRFDHVFCHTQSSVAAIREITRRPCDFMPMAVDALRFCPFPTAPPRTVDVCNIGRRHPAIHQVLLAQADDAKLFYIFDTVADFSVLDVREHRRFLSGLIKHSRYFMAFPPKFDQPDETGGVAEIGSRVFEGAAGGAVMLGMPSHCEPFKRCFDWPDAVIPVAIDGSDILDVIAELDANPQRVERIRRDNVVNTLLRHDWLYRWREILRAAGLPATAAMAEREERLAAMAAQLAGGVRVDARGRRRVPRTTERVLS